MTYKELARKAIEEIELGLRRQDMMPVAAHRAIAQPILEKAFRQLIKDFEDGACPVVASVQKAVPDLCDHCSKMILFALENEE